MRTLKFTIAYDGTRYAGWQVQVRSQKSEVGSRNERKTPTIQGTLERVLQQILQEPVTVIGSGRTDAGVHALAQSAHMRTRSMMPCARLVRSVNQLLPEDIAVMNIVEATTGFHARFGAISKRYRYRIFTGAVVPPFIWPYVSQVRAPLNVALMRREAAALRGRHDFRAFVRTSKRASNTVRTIYEVRLVRRGEELQLELEGNGFLHTMVRSMAGTLIDVGRGRLPSGTVRHLLKSGRRALTGTTAPAQGLVLVGVSYRQGRKGSHRLQGD